MATAKQFRTRIRSTQKTAQMTKTMQMVSAVRLRKTQEALHQATPYAEKMRDFFTHLHRTGLPLHHPLLTPRSIQSIALVVVTSDRGLCGAYNSRVVARAEMFLSEPRPCPVALVLIGKKAIDCFKNKQWPILHAYGDVAGKIHYETMTAITQQLLDDYLYGRADEIYLLTSQYLSAMSAKLVCEKFLNLSPETMSGDAPPPEEVQTILEPNLQGVLDRFLPAYAASRMYMALVSAFTAENASRMIAMQTATDNAKSMVRRLTLQCNKARQAAITREIVEIVSAGEALKGGR